MANIVMADVQGGKGLELLASGEYTKTDFATTPSKVVIPISYSGVAYAILIEATPLPNVGQTNKWLRYMPQLPEIKSNFNVYNGSIVYAQTNGVVNYGAASPYGSAGHISISASALTAEQRDTNYKVQDNTYRWYIWGVRS